MRAGLGWSRAGCCNESRARKGAAPGRLSASPGTPAAAPLRSRLSLSYPVLLLLLAGCGQPAGARFVDVTAASGVTFTHANGAAGKKLLPETMGAGVAVLDFDGDGRNDLYFVNGPGGPGHLYRNRGNGTFEDVTAGSGLDVPVQGMGAAVGDFDNDGRPDLFVTAVGGCRLFHNVGGRFEDVTEKAGVGGADAFHSSAAWLDFDGDGKLDLFVCRYVVWSAAADAAVDAVLGNGKRAYVPPTEFPATTCLLYRNRGDGSFEDVSEAAGVSAVTGKALGVAVCDPDGDGRPDVLVACDTTRTLFFRNLGGRFEEQALAVTAAYGSDGRPRGGMGVDSTEVWPGTLGVVVANFSNEPSTLLTLKRPGPLVFRDAADAAGLAGPSRGPMKFGAVFLDYDADGRPDLLTANGHLEPDIAAAVAGQSYAQAAQLFHNRGGRFDLVGAKNVGPDLFAPLVGRGLAVGDFDGDGVPDVVLTANGGPARLLRCADPVGKRLRLTVQGDGVTGNRDGVGAEVTVTSGGVSRAYFVSGCRGYLSCSELTVTAGLAGESVADVEVRWPGGGRQTWAGLAAGGWRLVQGRADAVASGAGF